MENQKGICRLSIMPVRAEGNDRSEQVTQLLFGEHFEVLEKQEKWIRIRIHYDSYEGWIDHRQFTPISEDYFAEINASHYHFCLEPSAALNFRDQSYLVVKGSVLPITSDEIFSSSTELDYQGETKPCGLRGGWNFVRQQALSYLNVPYLWGGRTHFGIDCSGFTQMVFRLAGYNINRDASQQVLQGDSVKDFSGINPGDLAFFASESGAITHVGIALEDHKIIHASGRVRIDRLDSKGILDEQTNTYTHMLSDIRRLLKT
jgi:hypothetical protein